MIGDIGQNLLNFLQAVIALNNHFISTFLKVGGEAWRGTSIILTGLIQGVSQIACYAMDLAQELLQIGSSIVAVCRALAVVLLQILAILLGGLEHIGAVIAGVLLHILRYGYESVRAGAQYLGVASRDTRLVVRDGVTTMLVSIRDGAGSVCEWTGDVAKLSFKRFAAFLLYAKSGSSGVYECIKENCAGAYEQICCASEHVCDFVRTNIPKDFYVWCACTLCLTSMLLFMTKYLSRRGLTFPSFVASYQTTRVLYIRNERDYDVFNLSDEDPDEDPEEDVDEVEEVEEEEDSTEVSEDESVEEYEVATSEEEDSEDEENENLINVQLPEITDKTHRTRATPFSNRSNCEMSQEALEKILEHERDRRVCVVCQDALKCVLVLPCRHMCLCIHCAHYMASLRIRQRICPLCRSRIQTIMNVFV